MFQKKDFGNTEVRRGLDAGDRSADANGPQVDLRGYGSALCAVSVGSTTTALSAANRGRVKVQHSDDNATWADCGAGDLLGDDVTDNAYIAVVDTDNTDEDKVRSGAYVGGKRYVRCVYDETGTVAALGISAVWVLEREQYQ